MDQRVSYQLRRARASGATGLGTEPVAVAPVVDDLKQTLDKVYRDKRVACTSNRGTGGRRFAATRATSRRSSATSWTTLTSTARSRVRVTAVYSPERLAITVADDGEGIDDEFAAQACSSGASALDESVPGQGIGLAVVRETVELYHGTLSVGKSASRRRGAASRAVPRRRAMSEAAAAALAARRRRNTS